MSKYLELKSISKSFETEKKIKVLKGLSQNFEKGKIYSIMGPSGSGKSTLLNLISLIDRPSSGQIMFNQNKINFNDTEQNDIFRSKKIGIVYQQNNLLSDFTAIENIYLASLANNNDKELAITKAKKLLKKIGLSNRSNHFPSQLSGGEAQRVAIARAIVNDPEIILADEPTGNLDEENTKAIVDLLFELKDEQETTLFLVTHSRELAKKCDRIIKIRDGK